MTKMVDEKTPNNKQIHLATWRLRCKLNPIMAYTVIFRCLQHAFRWFLRFLSLDDYKTWSWHHALPGRWRADNVQGSFPVSWKNVQPWFCIANGDSGLENGTSGVSVAETARLFVVVNGVHGCPVFVAAAEVTCRDARGWNKGNFTFGATFFVLDVA